MLRLPFFFLVTIDKVVVDGILILRLHHLLESFACLENFGSWGSRRTVDCLEFTNLGMRSIASLLAIFVRQDTRSLNKHTLCHVRDDILGGVVRMFAVNIDHTTGELIEEGAV